MTNMDDADLMEQKIRDRQLAAPLESETLQDLVKNELKTKKHTATEGLVWLVRYVPLFSSQLIVSVISCLPAHRILSNMQSSQWSRIHLYRHLPESPKAR